jgi:hypothetical protein
LEWFLSSYNEPGIQNINSWLEWFLSSHNEPGIQNIYSWMGWSLSSYNEPGALVGSSKEEASFSLSSPCY